MNKFPNYLVALTFLTLIFSCGGPSNPKKESETTTTPDIHQDQAKIPAKSQIVKDLEPLIGKVKYLPNKQKWALIEPNLEIFPFADDQSYADTIINGEGYYYEFRANLIPNEQKLEVETFEDRGQANMITFTRSEKATFKAVFDYSEMVGDPSQTRFYKNQGKGTFEEVDPNGNPLEAGENPGSTSFSDFLDLFPSVDFPAKFADADFRNRRKGEYLPSNYTQAFICDVPGSDRVCFEASGDPNMDYNTLDSYSALGQFAGQNGSIQLLYQEFYISNGLLFLASYTASGTLLSRTLIAGHQDSYSARSAEFPNAQTCKVTEIEYEYGKLDQPDQIKKTIIQVLSLNEEGKWEETQ